MTHSIEINATKEKVWEVLWSDQTFRDWASKIDPDTYMTGMLEEGSEVNFIGNNEGGIRYGVTNKVEKLVPFQHVAFKQIADIKVDQDGHIQKREKQWEGGLETYDIEELGEGRVKFTLKQDVPPELEEMFKVRVPQALERIKGLAEGK